MVLCDQIEKNKIDWAGSTHGEEESCVQVVGKPEGKDHLEDLGLDGRIILI